MHSVASAPGFNAVTSPVEMGLFGFSQLHQRSQSILILHGYPLSQQHLIKRLKETPNLSKFVVKRSTQAVREENCRYYKCGNVPSKIWKNVLRFAAASRWV